MFFRFRYWHSTTAYAIAKDSGAGMAEYLPPVNSALYSWPEDLLKPSAVVFLTTGEKERDQRLDTRDERTAEENELRDSQLFRKRYFIFLKMLFKFFSIIKQNPMHTVPAADTTH